MDINMDDIFVTLQFDGDRFSKYTMPVSVATDLAAYEELLIDVAKHMYLAAHPDKRRVPNGFGDVHLDIVRIDAGSAMPAMQLAGIDVSKNEQSVRFYVQARDIIAETIDAPVDKLPIEFPKSCLKYFNQFGRSLQEGEVLRLDCVKKSKKTELTCEKRKHLVLTGKRFYEKEVELSGFIEEADWDKSTFRLKLSEDSVVSIFFNDELIDEEKIRTSWGRPRDCVFVKGIARFDRFERIQNFVSIESVDIIRNFEISIAFDNIALLHDGWFEGLGKAPDATALQEIEQWMIDEYPYALPMPQIVPTQDGNLLFEWNIEGMPSVDIDLQKHTAYFHCFSSDGSDIEEDFLLTTPNGHNELLQYLSEKLVAE